VKNRIENERIENLQLTSSLGYKLDYESIQRKLGFLRNHETFQEPLKKESHVKVRTISQCYVQNRKRVQDKTKRDEAYYEKKHKRAETTQKTVDLSLEKRKHKKKVKNQESLQQSSESALYRNSIL
jgi:hypothetical protein